MVLYWHSDFVWVWSRKIFPTAFIYGVGSNFLIESSRKKINDMYTDGRMVFIEFLTSGDPTTCSRRTESTENYMQICAYVYNFRLWLHYLCTQIHSYVHRCTAYKFLKFFNCCAALWFQLVSFCIVHLLLLTNNFYLPCCDCIERNCMNMKILLFSKNSLWRSVWITISKRIMRWVTDKKYNFTQ